MEQFFCLHIKSFLLVLNINVTHIIAGFFIRSYKTHHFITHSGIYVGDNKFIHTSSKNGVTITSLDDPWWNEKFIFGTRIFE